jgi:hypothetical protein
MRQSGPHKKYTRNAKIKFKNEWSYGEVMHNMRVKEYSIMNHLKIKTKLNLHSVDWSFKYKVPVNTVQWTLPVQFKQFNYLMLYRDIILVCYEILTKHISKLCGQNPEILLPTPCLIFRVSFIYQQLWHTFES